MNTTLVNYRETLFRLYHQVPRGRTLLRHAVETKQSVTKDTTKKEYSSPLSTFIRPGLEATYELLHHLGDPHKRSFNRQFILVAGTNGKGYTASLLAKSLQVAGYKTGLFTSPHLLRFTERIRIDGKEISQQRLSELYEEVERASDKCKSPPTFFERVTAICLLYFDYEQVDIAVLEVGLGGRLDCTNVVTPALSVITRLGIDHSAYLGDTLQHMAYEKCGIVRAGGKVVVGPQSVSGQQEIKLQLDKRHADVTWVSAYNNVLVKDEKKDKKKAAANKKRQHHIAHSHEDNRETARAAFMAFGGSDKIFQKSAAGFIWLGRLQWLKPDLLVDGAHNHDGIVALNKYLSQLPFAPTHCLFSALADKEFNLDIIAEQINTFHLVPLGHDRGEGGEGSSAEELGQLENRCASMAPNKYVKYSNIEEGFDAAYQVVKQEEGRLLVMGSLFLVARVIALVTGEPCDPPIRG